MSDDELLVEPDPTLVPTRDEDPPDQHGLNAEQWARTAALNLAQPLLASTGLTGTHSPPLNDLLRLADWILTGHDYLFDEPQVVAKSYPIDVGTVTILGPDVFVDSDREVICWNGQDYRREEL